MWLADLLLRLAQSAESASLPHTAATETAPGCDAPDPDAAVTASPSAQTDGALVPLRDPNPPNEASMRDVLVARTERALAEAIQLHAQATRAEAGILTNYVVICETVDPNLDNEVDKRSLQLLTSPDMTAWSLVGFSAALSQAVYNSSF